MPKPICVTYMLFLILFCRCSTDFEIEAAGRDLPVVYGLIDVRDTAHYIRVERAFLSGEADAATVAQRIDSLYYGTDLTVVLEKGATGAQFPLTRVDGNLEGFPRQEGPFVNAPNILYKIRASELGLAGGEDLKLIIDRGGGLPLVTAETRVLSPIELVDNLPPDPFSLGNYLSSRRIAWRTQPEAVIFDVRMRLHYLEPVPGQSGEMQEHTLEWVLSKSFPREENSPQVNYTFLSEAFFQFIGGSLEPPDAGRREFLDLDILVTGGAEAFSELITIAQANVGITSGSGDIPVFTNISDGRGIFASRTSDLRTGIKLHASSLDSLRNGIYTADLGF